MEVIRRPRYLTLLGRPLTPMLEHPTLTLHPKYIRHMLQPQLTFNYALPDHGWKTQICTIPEDLTGDQLEQQSCHMLRYRRTQKKTGTPMCYNLKGRCRWKQTISQ